MVEVVAPADYIEEVKENLASRRGEISSVAASPGGQLIRALVPLSEMFGYASDLHQRTFGQGSFATEFKEYRSVRDRPPDDPDAPVRYPRNPSPPARRSAI
jgi:elongation factor G